MAWFCPTFKRPERLAHLALSWDKYQPGKKLYVRVWDQDPRKQDYLDAEWPDGWEFYISPKQYAAEALQEFYEKYPQEPYYGFIGDDVVLRTRGGLEVLEKTCMPFFLSYPDDTFLRHRLCTHFCIAGALVKMVGWISPPELKHCHIDTVWWNLTMHAGLNRYCPQVVFDHRHFLTSGAPFDETYGAIWTADKVGREDVEPMLSDNKYLKEKFQDVLTDRAEMLRQFFIDSFEDEQKWRREDERWANGDAS